MSRPPQALALAQESTPVPGLGIVTTSCGRVGQDSPGDLLTDRLRVGSGQKRRVAIRTDFSAPHANGPKVDRTVAGCSQMLDQLGIPATRMTSVLVALQHLRENPVRYFEQPLRVAPAQQRPQHLVKGGLPVHAGRLSGGQQGAHLSDEGGSIATDISAVR